MKASKANGKSDIGKGHLGIIEGFYGKPWSFEKRLAMIPFMKARQYSFFLYAPKADRYLREDWRESVPQALLDKLKNFGSQLQSQGILWGIGLSPFELHKDFNAAEQALLKQKLEQLKALNCDYLAILFDDMSGDVPDLAQQQLAICDFIKQQGMFSKLLMCPSYYCFDPILEKVFGKMPERYLETLGEQLDQDFEILWTGEKVCSQEYSLAHLEQVQALLKRKPFIWDNYPVNDGAGMSPFLHLRGFEGRQWCGPEHVNGIAVNPMNEASLSMLPMATLSDCLRNPQQYSPGKSLAEAVQAYCGEAASELLKDIPVFQDQGLHQLTAAEKQALIDKYSHLRTEANQAFIDELLAYLRGEYLFDLKADSVPTQHLWESEAD